MSKTFLITSHTEGIYPFEQRTILHGLVTSLKKYFPECFIVIASQSEVDFDTQKLVDYVVIDKKTTNVPYGAGEVALLTAGLAVLKKFNRSDFYKIVYDFLIDDTNYHVFDKWASLNKEFVSTLWKTVGVGIGSWVWYSKTKFFEEIFDFNYLDMYLEPKLLESVNNKNLMDKIYLYDPHEQMFDGDWYSRCDLVHAGGSVLKHNYGNVIAVLEITDDREYMIAPVGYSIANQERKPNHVLLVDKRSIKDDLRFKKGYQELFDYFSKKNLPWNLIYYTSENQILNYLQSLNFNWCWLIDSNLVLENNCLKDMYRTIILNYEVGTIIDSNSNLLYRNQIIEKAESNTNLKRYILDTMTKTSYNNIRI